ncbi:TPA: YxeA family protein [Enterococcus faecalis]|nr:YxeA family protein [Enterococcus faecalis]
MKTLLKILIPIVILAGGSWGVYNGGEAYYTQITTSGEKKDEKTNSGEAMTIYYYQQPAFNKNGEEKTVELNESRDQPLRMKAYLKLKVNPRKGVISWNEVTEKEVPEKALEKLK